MRGEKRECRTVVPSAVSALALGSVLLLVVACGARRGAPMPHDDRMGRELALQALEEVGIDVETWDAGTIEQSTPTRVGSPSWAFWAIDGPWEGGGNLCIVNRESGSVRIQLF